MRPIRLLTAIALMAAAPAGPRPAWAGPADIAGAVDKAVDSGVRPGDDFYRYANGPWLKAVEVPPGQTGYGTSSLLVAENARRVRALIEDAARAPKTDLQQKIGDYYASRLESGAIDARGLTPLAADLTAIAAIQDRQALAAWLGGHISLDDGTDSHVDSLFGVWVHQGFHDPDHYVPHIVQGGLGLYDRGPYLDPAPNSLHAAARQAYRAHVATVFKAAGFTDAEARAARVLALETEIARVHASADDTNDVFKTDNSWTRSDFDTRAPGLDWPVFFRAAGLDRQATFVVWQPGAVIGGAALVASQPLDAWKDYLAFHLIDHYAGVLPASIPASITGTPVSDRSTLAIAATTDALGEGIGRLYVARWFPPASKQAAETMVANIRTVFRAHVAAAAWMSPATRTAAMTKLDALQIGLGYPDRWTDYTSLEVVRGDAFGNLRRAEAFARRQSLARLGRPVDPAEWALLPQTVGAILNFSPNAMQFSAGLLQPPYFDATGDLAGNYGSAGAGLAHEVSHSFDGLGRLYDARGNLAEQWTAEDSARYDAATQPLARQMDTDCPAPDLCVHGSQVEQESVADLVGLRVAYEAYHLALHGQPDRIIDGLTGDQRFFLAFARRWRKVQTDDALRRQVATDPHLPPEYRADAVRNLDAWYAAFAVKPGDRLYLKPEDRVRLW